MSAADHWKPTVQSRTDIVTAASAQALHDLLDRPGPAPADGQPLPILWHWLAFLPQARQADLGVDGHPRTGGFLPPTGDRIRMYAGGTVSRTGHIVIGEGLHRISTVTDVTEKTGRSGPLLFVTVRHDLTGADGTITETADIVYRWPSTPGPGQPAALGDDTSCRDVDVTPPLLFRFSALTYNAHRIHYDRDYATGVENYPGMVVHGPLQAILLADLITTTRPDQSIAQFRFRSTAPAFDTAPLTLRLSDDTAAGITQAAAASNGRQTMIVCAEGETS